MRPGCVTPRTSPTLSGVSSTSGITSSRATTSPACRICGMKAVRWCRDFTGQRVHGTTRSLPLRVFQDEERHALAPWNGEPYEVHRPAHHESSSQPLRGLPVCPVLHAVSPAPLYPGPVQAASMKPLRRPERPGMAHRREGPEREAGGSGPVDLIGGGCLGGGCLGDGGLGDGGSGMEASAALILG